MRGDDFSRPSRVEDFYPSPTFCDPQLQHSVARFDGVIQPQAQDVTPVSARGLVDLSHGPRRS